MSKLLMDEQPLMILPKLAMKIGLYESVIVQQVHYWLLQKKNARDGYYWTYNTYGGWAEQFPFWSESTVRRAINGLEDKGILISGNYNKLKIDKTKWYRINYEILRTYEDENGFDGKVPMNNTTAHTEQMDWSDRLIGETHESRPLPKTITKTTTKNNTDIKDITFPSEMNPITEIFNHYNSKGIVKHAKLLPIMEKEIKARLKMYDLETILKVIDNYNVVYRGDQYYWDRKYTLAELMREKDLYKFSDECEPLTKMLKFDRNNGGNRNEINGRNTTANKGQAFSIGLPRSSSERQNLQVRDM